MSEQTTLAPPATSRLEPNAISVAQDTLIGLADTGPTVTVLFTLVALVVASCVRGSADAGDHRDSDADHRQRLPAAEPVERQLRRLVRVGRPGDQPLSRLHHRLADAGWHAVRHAHAGHRHRPVRARGVQQAANSKWPNIIIATVVVAGHARISIVGIRISARTQVGIGVVEYLILIVFAVWGLIWVLGHHAGTVRSRRRWFSLHGIGGKGGPGGRLPHHRVHVQRLGRHALRERGSPAPPGQPGPGRDDRGRRRGRPVHLVAGRPAGRGVRRS